MDFSGFHNGRPCKACTSAEEMLAISKKLAARKQAVEFLNNAQDHSKAESSANTSELEDSRPIRRSDCPVDKDELGRSTWNLLHTMTVYYPDKPTDQDKKNMSQTLDSLSKTYPCPPCAEDLRKDLKVNPPNLENRDGFAQWMCEMHNRVNVKLGKEKFDCRLVMERWYDGWKDGSCD